MFAHGESASEVDLTPRQVVTYIEEIAIELADLAAKHGRTELAASLSIVAIQASGDGWVESRTRRNTVPIWTGGTPPPCSPVSLQPSPSPVFDPSGGVEHRAGTLVGG